MSGEQGWYPRKRWTPVADILDKLGGAPYDAEQAKDSDMPSQCGAGNVDEERFCNACGTRMPVVASAADGHKIAEKRNSGQPVAQLASF